MGNRCCGDEEGGRDILVGAHQDSRLPYRQPQIDGPGGHRLYTLELVGVLRQEVDCSPTSAVSARTVCLLDGYRGTEKPRLSAHQLGAE
jgi:hypothetical protein